MCDVEPGAQEILDTQSYACTLDYQSRDGDGDGDVLHCTRCKVTAEPPREAAINREKARSRSLQSAECYVDDL